MLLWGAWGPLLGCSPGAEPPTACELVAGDLVITELFADPSGADAGSEWWELHNPGPDPRQLEGLTLEQSRLDGSARKRWRIPEELALSPGAYLVVGDRGAGVAGDAVPDLVPVDLDYGRSLGSLANTSGRLAVGCGPTVIDEVTYHEAAEGVSLLFDGGLVPDSAANDIPSRWCAATQRYTELVTGSPGFANEPCGADGSPPRCREGEDFRPAVWPELGDLVITELHANPSTVADVDGEWIELYAHRTVDLNGLAFRIGATDEPAFVLDQADCMRLQAHEYFVLARQTEENGGLPRVDQILGFGLANQGVELSIGVGREILDRVPNSSGVEGAALGLDPRHFSPRENDDPNNWCLAVSPYGDGDLGTPGTMNDPCDLPPRAGECEDGEQLRAASPPGPGDLVITEVMADPAVVDDRGGEWFEVLANRAVDLQGLVIQSREGTHQTSLEGAACLPVAAGVRIVFARNPDPSQNGGLPTAHPYGGVSLTNGAGDLSLLHAGRVLDSVRWVSTTPGVAHSYYQPEPSSDGNDDLQHWCEAASEFGDGDLGTPGAPNPPCAMGPSVADACEQDGVLRPIVPPAPGELLLSEIMANPAAEPDTAGEWFEVYARAPVDLNGLGVGPTPERITSLVSERCLRIAAGEYAAICRATSSLPGALVELPNLSLVNTGGALVLVSVGKAIDEYAWASAPAGVSLCREVESTSAPWSLADTAQSYGAGDHGTPGKENTCQ